MNLKRRQLTLLAGAAALGVAAPLARAQDKPLLKVLVGFPPGGSVDVVARLLADNMKSSLDQNVIVDNKPGAAGRVALGELKRAAPDGNTVALVASGALVILPWLYRNVGYDPARDFTPIARVTTFDFAITVGPAAPSRISQACCSPRKPGSRSRTSPTRAARSRRRTCSAARCR